VIDLYRFFYMAPMSHAKAVRAMGQEPQLGGVYDPIAGKIMCTLMYPVDFKRIFYFPEAGTDSAK
jgi:hypothetical protein